MPKGFFSQGLCILLSEPVSLDQIAQALTNFHLVDYSIAGEDELLDQPSLLLPFRKEANGSVVINVVDAAWPDDMGDPQEQPEIFVAWSLGQYGPFAFPGAFTRSTEQSWAWEHCSEIAPKHTCFIRILSSYVIGEKDDDSPLLPLEYDAVAELEFMTKVASALLSLPEAICYFNPGGEVLRDEDGLREGLNYAWNHHLPPLDMWTNVRLFHATDEWSLMDTVGNGQFDVPDVEAAFITDKYDAADVEGFLRNASLYLVKEGSVIEEGDTADGPGDIVWTAIFCDDALTDPPRETIRWFPNDGSQAPAELTDTGMTEDEVEEQLNELLDFDESDDDEAPF